MPEIKNYGRTLAGAAKDRKRSADGIIIDRHGETLGEIFPTPDWQGLIANGARAINVSVARVLREELTSAPKNLNKRGTWYQDVVNTGEMAQALIDPSMAARTLNSIMRNSAFETIVIKARIYENFGHDRSLSDLRVFRHDAETLILAKGSQAIAMEETGDDIVEAARKYAGKILGQKITWFTRPKTPDKTGPTTLCAKLGTGRLVDVEDAPTLSEAKRRISAEMDRLCQAFDAARKTRTRKATPDTLRTGPRRRLRNVTAAEFANTFGLSSIEFGASLTDAQRQREMNATFDAFVDLAEIMGEPHAAIGLRKTLGVSFGARGKGGKNAAMAHYSIDLRVINMTKRLGAGSLAHEWFHGFDNAASPKRYGFVSEDPLGTPMRVVMRVCAETGMEMRSQRQDIRQGKKYFSKPCEIAARAFETWVQYRLTAQGRKNDYLVTIPPQPAEGSKELALYAYPLASEIPMLDAAFSQMFGVSPVQEVEIKPDRSPKIDKPVLPELDLSQPEFDF